MNLIDRMKHMSKLALHTINCVGYLYELKSGSKEGKVRWSNYEFDVEVILRPANTPTLNRCLTELMIQRMQAPNLKDKWWTDPELDAAVDALFPAIMGDAFSDKDGLRMCDEIANDGSLLYMVRYAALRHLDRIMGVGTSNEDPETAIAEYMEACTR